MHGDCGKWEGLALKPQVNHTGWMTVVAPADRPKSVRNSCVIERICSVFVSFYLCRDVYHTAASILFLFLLIDMLRITDKGPILTESILSILSIQLGIKFYLFVSHGGMKRQRVHV